jgi:hypothetical protein
VPRSKAPIISLEEAKARFEEWRQNRKGKAAIPDELWSAAAEVARKEGVSRTSTELRVEWNELKRRMRTDTGVSRQTVPAFVELVAPRAQSPAECTIELEGRYSKLRIRFKGASASYLAQLSRELLESAF